MSATQRPHPIVVVGFDGSPASHVALSRGIARVGTTGKLYLVHAWQPPGWPGREQYRPTLDRRLTEAEALVADAARAHPGLADVAWESELIGERPAEAIAAVAVARDAEEIVLGTRGLGRVRALLGSVAHEVIHLAPCPVTVIPERMVAEHADSDRDQSAAPA